MSKRLIFIILTLFIICNNIKSDNHNYLKKVIERLNSVEEELRNIRETNPNATSAEKTSINYIDSIANHEQRLVDIEEEIRGLNGFLEEINYKMLYLNTSRLNFGDQIEFNKGLLVYNPSRIDKKMRGTKKMSHRRKGTPNGRATGWPTHRNIIQPV